MANIVMMWQVLYLNLTQFNKPNQCKLSEHVTESYINNPKTNTNQT
jgi:hypothetical protein